MSFGVAAGASTPNQVPMSKPFRPASSSVGTSGSADERLAVVTASARSLPALMCGSTGVIVSKDIVTWPPSRSVASGPLPLYGMWTQLGAGQVLELRADQVLRRAVAVGAVAQLAGLAPWPVATSSATFLAGVAGVDDQHVGHQRDRRDRREVLLEVVGQLLVDAGGDRVVHRADQQRVAVRLGLGHVVGAERRAGAGLALDDHGLAEALLSASRPARGPARRWCRRPGTARSG